MTNPQPGIFAKDPPHNLFLEYALKPDASDVAVKAALKDALALTEAPGQYSVFGFGNDLWRRIASGAPDKLKNFEALGDSKGFYAPAP
ncbi:MAG: hypothetical protein VW268_00825 [Rhodospirillaceae bacterium]